MSDGDGGAIAAGPGGTLYNWVGESNWVGGTTCYSRGEFIYQDYLYDDYGAATGLDATAGSPTGLNLSPTTGSYRYPAEEARYGANCADLLQLRLAADGQKVYVLILLNTLLVPDSTVAAVAFQADGQAPNPAVPAHRWPFEAGITTPGTQHVLTLWGTDGAWDEQELASVGGQVVVSVEANTIEAAIPRGLLGTLRFWCYAATGLWDARNRMWMEVKQRRDAASPGGAVPGGPRAFNLAFRSGETGTWFEDKQAAYLRCGPVSARTGSALGDLHMAAQFVDLENPADTPQSLPTGYHERIYEASRTLGEGVSEAGVEARGATGAKLACHYLGRHQPYTVYAPREYDGLLLFLHGGGGNHTGIVSSPAFQQQLGDLGRNLIVCPLSRGPVGGHVDYSYLDDLEVLEDVLQRYPVDRRRVYVAGWSMGGQGASRFMVTRPDLFAGSFLIAPGEIRPPADPRDVASNPGVTIDLYENLRHIPILFTIGSKDTTQNTEFSLAKLARLKELGYEYRAYIHPLFGHLDFSRCDHWLREMEWLKDRTLVERPARVTYKACEAWWRPEISPRLVFDRAYWVAGLRARDNSLGLSSFATVDVQSYALPDGEPGLSRVSYAMPGPPSAHTVEGQDYLWPGQTAERYNGFQSRFDNVKTVTLDAEVMGLSLRQPVRFTTTSDGPTQLCLAGAWAAVRLEEDGRPARLGRPKENLLVVEVVAGEHRFEVQPA